jgi:hypothetical protein
LYKTSNLSTNGALSTGGGLSSKWNIDFVYGSYLYPNDLYKELLLPGILIYITKGIPPSIA